MSIFDEFDPQEMRDIFREPTESWPEDFCVFVNDLLSDELLDDWLDNHNDAQYRERIRDIIEAFTYGYTDEHGNELLEFDENVENDGQMRLF